MRRSLLSFIAVSLMLGITPVAAEPGAGAAAYQEAIAMWVDLKGSKGTFYGAFAERFAHSSEVSTVGTIIKGRCTRRRSGHLVIVMCSGEGRARDIALQDFQLDPLLGSASLRVKMKGFTHQVSWEGRGETPQFFGGVGGDDTYLDAGAGMARDARATGRLYGKKMTGRASYALAYLAQAAGAAGWTRTDEGSYRVTRSADGVVALEYRFVAR